MPTGIDISDEIIAEVKRLHKLGMLHKVIAKKLNISVDSVERIASGRIYKTSNGRNYIKKKAEPEPRHPLA